MKLITVQASSCYDIIIERGCLSFCGEKLVDIANTKRFAIVTDDTVDRLYGAMLVHTLSQQGCTVVKFTFAHGEASKSSDTLLAIYEFLAQNNITRADCLIALGGGVVGDLTGFAAATYLRGIRYIQIPTTLLAQIDSSVGGKTAINLPCGKNLVGAFKQPALVLCDPQALSSLPQNILADGMAEAIKYGMIRDEALFDLIRSHTLDTVSECIDEIIARCIEIKRDIVDTDEFDTGERMVLNFGHTLGHAIETHSEYRYTHGQAVAIGMSMITACVAPTDVQNALADCLNAYRLPAGYDAPIRELTAICGKDKKRKGDTLDFVICKSIGNGIITSSLLSEFRRMVEQANGH